MNILQGAWNDISGFFGYDELLKILKTGNYSELLTLKGIEAAIGPILPLILVFEIIRAAFYKRFKVFDYKISFFTFVFNAFIGQVISIGAYVFCVGLFQPHAIFDTTFTWYWFIYSYVVWEFSHFIYHFLAHKVRILWCLHSTHHAPASMNLSVSYAHFFLEGPYATVIRTSICMLLGVNPAVLAVIMFIDGTWGGFIHIGENIAEDARFGFLGKIILTPSHHRVHHAKNPKYMDTNFCNLLNIWDKVFGTYEPEDRSIPIEYGISRPMKPHSFLDAYFGEIVALGKDVAKAPGLKNKVLYIFMPPGWSHTGDHKTSAVVRKAYFEGEKNKQESKSQELVDG